MNGEQKTIAFALLVWLAVVLLLFVMSLNASGDEQWKLAEVAKCRRSHREAGGIRPTLADTARDAGVTAGPQDYMVTRWTPQREPWPIWEPE